MASIKKRPDGQWRARYRDGTGKEHAKHFDRKVDGQRWLDEQTARVSRYRGPVVLCATDYLDSAGRRIGRQAANYYYVRQAWHMQPVAPPGTPVPWLDPERSPKDPWSWVPGRDHYE